jgi:hypothetical protein
MNSSHCSLPLLCRVVVIQCDELITYSLPTFSLRHCVSFFMVIQCDEYITLQPSLLLFRLSRSSSLSPGLRHCIIFCGDHKYDEFITFSPTLVLLVLPSPHPVSHSFKGSKTSPAMKSPNEHGSSSVHNSTGNASTSPVLCSFMLCCGVF